MIWEDCKWARHSIGKPLICMRRTWIRNCAVDCLYQCIIACQCTSIRPSYELMLSSRENGPALPCWVCRVGWEFWRFFWGGGNLVKNRTIFLKVFSSGSLSPIWLSSTTPLRGIFPAQHEPSMTLADVKGFFGSRYICLLVCDFSLGILGSFEKTNAVNFGKAEGSNQEQWRVHILKISLKNSKGEEFFADLVFTSQRAVGNKQELQSHENPDEPDIKSTFVMWW